ncbi:unnamed protein product [Mytilus coruscus]|uniref:Fucolectin tachylectin-4 pentraxin-1 domain-containing protein n=1 Tax=Mytilus coruscus TaxID=42192 RepID=A0A6J8CPB4_MYTCO|nr:unnamed protein product [Mytilus coruscus]
MATTENSLSEVSNFFCNAFFLFSVLQTKKSVIRNVALRKRSQQSSWYGNTRSWGNYMCCATDYANDGNATTFAVTNHDNMPYWWVDLGHVYDIKRIEIINRSDISGERLHDVDITVGPTLKELSLCAHYKGPGKTRQHLVFRCNRQMWTNEWSLCQSDHQRQGLPPVVRSYGVCT